MATKHENEILAVVANDVKHLIDEVAEVKSRVVEINGGLRRAQTDVAVMQQQGQQHGGCIEDLYKKYGGMSEKYDTVDRSIGKLLGIGAAVGAVVTGVMAFIAWIVGMI